MNAEASGWWMLASAVRASAAGMDGQEVDRRGAGITIPMRAASRSIR